MPFEIRPYQEADITAVVNLWTECGLVIPEQNPHQDIAAKIRFQPELFLIAQQNWQLIGTVMAGYEGHWGWLRYLAVDPEYQRRGYGSLLVEAAETRLKDLGCRKVNLLVREKDKAPLAFFRSVGFRAEDLINMGKPLETPDDPDA